MISSAEFQQTLQAGDIHQALALLVRDTRELDITTRLTEDLSTSEQMNNSGYLRTKINLLTGEIQNEVSKDIFANSHNYLKLQQLHHDRIIAADRIVQGYFSQLQAILVDLPPAPAQTAPVASAQFNSESLLARLTQAAALSSDPVINYADSDLSSHPTASHHDDLDLSIDPEGAVWEEWVEDEDFSTEPAIDKSASLLSKSDWEENWVQRHLNSMEAKSPHPHTSDLTPIAARWDKFAPECLNID